MFERTLDIISLFKQYQFISEFFYAVPREKVRKMKLVHTDSPDLKNKIDKNNLYVTCTQN